MQGPAPGPFWQGRWRRGILAGMDAPEKRRWYCPTPGWLVYGSLVVEGLLWLSEQYRWFRFNEHKGWTVLIAVAVVGVTILLMLLWFTVALLFRRRFQFGIRSLLVLVVVVAVPCSWMAVKRQQAKREQEAAAAIETMGGHVLWSGPSGPAWLRNLLGDDFYKRLFR